MSPLEKYLHNYAEPEIQYSELITQSFDYVLVVPSYNETVVSWNALQHSIPIETSCCIILIINCPDDKPLSKDYLTLLTYLKSTLPIITEKQNATLLTINHKQQLLIIDRCHTPIPKKEGVGLARKIGADIAAQLINKKKIKSPWIFTTDMDVTFPDNYFLSCSNKSNDISALLFPFTHAPSTNNKKLNKVTMLYEAWLQHYVDGLAYAKSPYAFHTIGSILTINAQHYGKVRGFPKLAAGEDFHLLNKLAKTGVIESLIEPIITIESRLSNRTPFGTGPAVSLWMLSDSPEEELRFYNPKVFILLKEWLNWVNNINEETLLYLKGHHINWMDSLDKKIIAGLLALNFEKNMNGFLAQSRSPSALMKHIHLWFDGLKTLRFIHALENNGLSKISFITYQQEALL